MKRLLLPTILAALTALLVISPAVSIWQVGTAEALEDTNPQQAGQALEIAPPVLNLTADPGEVLQAKISLRDISSTSLLVTSEINDFTASGEDGTPKVILDTSEPSPYSLISWIQPIPSVTLKSRQIQNVPVTINVPANAAPGGYYGVIRFTASAPAVEENGVSLSASIGALVFVRVKGDANEAMKVAEFFVSKDGANPGFFFDSTPLQFTQRLKNDGNVHEQPIGRILITDMFGRPAVNLNVNLEGRNVLPGTIRKFDVPLDKTAIGDKMMLGPYTATLTVKYGANNQEMTQRLTFWLIPWKLILLVLIVIVALIAAGRILIKKYNAWILSQHSGRNRRR